MKPMNQRLYDFWFGPAPATRLALLRILVGVFILWWFIPRGEYDDFLEVAQTDPILYAPVGLAVFHGIVDFQLFEWLLRATMITGLCFTLGLWFRITGPVFAGLYLWIMCYRMSWSMIYHSDNLVVLHVIILGLTRSADALSLDALFRNWGRPNASAAATTPTGWQYNWPVQLMCALVVSSYFVCAIAKLAAPLGLSWMSGENLRAQVAVDAIRKELLGSAPNPVAYSLYGKLPLFTVLAVGSMILEFFAPLALLKRRWGCIWAVNAFLMHWGILLVMDITFHYQLTGVMYLAFFRVERILDLPGKLGWRRKTGQAERLPSQSAPDLAPQPGIPRATLYYDGECGRCDRFVQFVLRHDEAQYFQFATLQSEAGREQLRRLGLDERHLNTVVLVERDQAYVRSTATLRVCRRLAGLWTLLYVFIVVPRSWRDGIYSLVARNRKLWFKAPDACAVMPPEWRRRFVN